MPSIIRHLLLIHPQALIRAALRCLIETWPDIECVAEAADVVEALVAIARKQPDVILLDIDSCARFGVEAIPALLSGVGHARILLLNGEHNVLAQRQAIHRGAMGVVLKEKPPEVLHKALQHVQAGEVWIDRATIAQVLSDLTFGAPADISPDVSRIGLLTNRERQVVALIGEGLKNKQIASRMAISEPTVRHHLTSIFDKLGVKNRLELVIFAHGYNLAAPSRERQAVG
jgi:DNA-binding NarL/FixJ family response regulator